MSYVLLLQEVLRSVKSMDDISIEAILKWALVGFIALGLLWGLVFVLRQLHGFRITFD